MTSFKTNGFHVAMLMCSVADQRQQNVVRTSVNDLVITLCATFFCVVTAF